MGREENEQRIKGLFSLQVSVAFSRRERGSFSSVFVYSVTWFWGQHLSTEMVSDQELANGVAFVLGQSDLSAGTSVNGIVKQLEVKLGLDLSHKANFIRDQIELIRRSSQHPSNDHFIRQHHPQFQINHPFVPSSLHRDLQVHYPPPPPTSTMPLPLPLPLPQPQQQPPNALVSAPPTPKESTQSGGKRRGGPGGLNKVCGVSPELQTIVGEPALPRTEIVKQLWAYIRKNNLQDPSNKRKIICNDELRLVFETDCTDMFKMNKLLAKHIIPLEPSKDSAPDSKRLRAADATPAMEGTESSASTVIISDTLANFFGTPEREMPQSEAVKRVLEYVKVNKLEDPLNSVEILCDAKLQELFGCESLSASKISQMLFRHFYSRS